MDFEEFLWAKSDTVTADAIRYAFEKKKPLGDAVHRKIMQTFRTYMVVGGMPQAVSAFVEGRSYREIDFIKRNILSLYEDDLKKHDNDSNKKASIISKRSRSSFPIGIHIFVWLARKKRKVSKLYRGD